MVGIGEVWESEKGCSSQQLLVRRSGASGGWKGMGKELRADTDRREKAKGGDRDVASSSSSLSSWHRRRRTLVYLTTSSAPPCRMERRLGTSERNPTRQPRLHLTEWNLSTDLRPSNKIQIRRGSACVANYTLLLLDQFEPF